MIDLYTSTTPSCGKLSVTLSELGLALNAHIVNMQSDDQKTPEYLAINPTGGSRH